jgi:hypothetical protein
MPVVPKSCWFNMRAPTMLAGFGFIMLLFDRWWTLMATKIPH